jgi:hypothetical protein
MSRFVKAKQRQLIAERARFCCEYCHLPDIDSYYGFHIDHIVSWRHGGKTQLENLAYACPDCNRNKGTDLGTLLDNPNVIVRFFHPRSDDWNEHFQLHETGFLEPRTNIGRATVNILAFNHPDRIIERNILIRLGLMASTLI